MPLYQFPWMLGLGLSPLISQILEILNSIFLFQLSLLELLKLLLLLASLGSQLQEKNPRFQWLQICGKTLSVVLSRLFVLMQGFSQTN